MSNTLNLGDGKWAAKEGSLLAYNSENGNYKPLPFNFERGSSATVINKDGLIETVGSDMPRIDYKDDSEGALLLEPQRTNIITQSEAFDNAYWTKSDASVASGFVSPNGTNNAFKLVEGVSNSEHYINGSGTTLTNMSHSIYVKSAGRSQIKLFDSSRGHYAWFNLADGTIGSSTATSSSITPMYNGWYRITISKISTGFSQFRLYLGIAESDSYTGNGTSGVYIYGAQLEQGSYATSYIPTQGSTVTRLADSCSQTVPDSIFGANEVSFVIDFETNGGTPSFSNIFNTNRDTTNSFGVTMQDSTGLLKPFLFESGVNVVDMTSTTSFLNGVRGKIAVGCKSGDSVLVVKGNVEDTNSATFSDFNVNEIYLNDIVTFFGYNSNVKINDFKLYNTRLSNSELQALTS